MQYPNKVVPLCSRWRVSLFLKSVHVQACVQGAFCISVMYIYTHTLLSPCCAYCICFFFWEFPIVLRFSIAGPLCLVQYPGSFVQYPSSFVQYPSSFVQYPSSFMPLCLWRRISLLLKFLLTVWNIQVHARWEKRGRLWWRSDFCEVGYVCNRVHCLFARPLTVTPFFLFLFDWVKVLLP